MEKKACIYLHMLLECMAYFLIYLEFGILPGLKMIGNIYSQVIDILEDFSSDLKNCGIDYELKCLRKRRSCLVFVTLRSILTDKRVLHLNLKIRNWNEFGNIQNLLDSCRYFASMSQRSASPDY